MVRPEGRKPRAFETTESAAQPSPAPDPFDANPIAGLFEALRLPRTGRSLLWRAPFLAIVAWLPLLVFALIEKSALGPSRWESFLGDLSAQVRYLVAIPLLTVAELWCLPRLGLIARHFVEAGIVPAEERPRFQACLLSARGLLGRRDVATLLILAAYSVTLGINEMGFSLYTRPWIAPARAGPHDLTLAGWWWLLVSQPLYLVLWGAWLWRVMVWARFLRAVSKLDLRLVPTHPDLAAGLGFTASALKAFAPLALAFGFLVAGTIAQDMLLSGEPPSQTERVLALVIAIGAPLCLFAGPLLFFLGPMGKARRRGMFEYGGLASAIGRRFEKQWLQAKRLDPESVGAPDVSVTSDLYLIVANVSRMRVLPFGLRDLIGLAITSCLPFVPIAFVVLPMDEVFEGIVNIFL